MSPTRVTTDDVLATLDRMASGEPLSIPSQAAALIIGVTPATLAGWRRRGGGPPYWRLGAGRGRVIYRSDDLDRWLAAKGRLNMAQRLNLKLVPPAGNA